MTNEGKIICLEARKKILIANGKDNSKIIKKIERKIRNLKK